MKQGLEDYHYLFFCAGGQRQQGLSGDSAKLVMECIHSSGIKRIGITFLAANAQQEESSAEAGMYSPYEALNVEEIEVAQTKLGRMIVTFLELLHLLIARNRDVLLTTVQSRKRRAGDASSVASGSVYGSVHGSIHGGYATTPRAAGSHSFSPMKRLNGDRNTNDNGLDYSTFDRTGNEIVGRSIIADTIHSQVSNNCDRTENAIGVQSELQRGLVSLVKALSHNLLDTLSNEIPRWMRSCCQDSNYFSTGQYRKADIPLGEELFFNVDTSGDDGRGSKSDSSHAVPRSIIRGPPHREGSPNGSLCSGTSDRRAISSDRPPTDRSNHRRNISGTSYASLRGTL